MGRNDKNRFIPCLILCGLNISKIYNRDTRTVRFEHPPTLHIFGYHFLHCQFAVAMTL